MKAIVVGGIAIQVWALLGAAPAGAADPVEDQAGALEEMPEAGPQTATVELDGEVLFWVVRIHDVTGDVAEVRLRVTHLRTVKNEEVIVPNSKILSDEVVNYSSLARTRGLILHTTVRIGYETPWRQVAAILRMAADRTTGLLKDPEPFVRQTSLGDFAVTYELNAYCDNAQAMNALYSDMHRNILDVFNEYGVQIMTAAYEGDPAEPKVVPKERWHVCQPRGELKAVRGQFSRPAGIHRKVATGADRSQTGWIGRDRRS